MNDIDAKVSIIQQKIRDQWIAIEFTRGRIATEKDILERQLMVRANLIDERAKLEASKEVGQ